MRLEHPGRRLGAKLRIRHRFRTEIAIEIYKTMHYDVNTPGNYVLDKFSGPVYKPVIDTSSSGLVWVAWNIHIHSQRSSFTRLCDSLFHCFFVVSLTPKTAIISGIGPNVTFLYAAGVITAVPPGGGGASALIAVTHHWYYQVFTLCDIVPELNLSISVNSHTNTAPNARCPMKVLLRRHRVLHFAGAQVHALGHRVQNEGRAGRTRASHVRLRVGI